jgi:DNA primase
VAAVEEARPFLAFRVERVLGAGDLRSAEGRARTAEAALEMIREHPSELVRDQYVMEVADRCRIEPDRLRALLTARRDPARARGTGAARGVANGEGGAAALVATPRRGAGGPELEALRHVIHSWDAVGSWLHADLFADPLHRAAFTELVSHETVAEAVEVAHPAVAQLITGLAVEDPDSDPFDVVVRLVTEASRRALADLRARLVASPEDLDALATQQWVRATLGALDDDATRTTAAEQLVAWLGTRGEEGA